MSAEGLQLVQYVVNGARVGVIPDMGLTVGSTPDGGALTAVVSEQIADTLPDDLEVAVEVWSSTTNDWIEPRDARFIITGSQYDDRDPTGTKRLTAIPYWVYFTQRAELFGVEPYEETGLSVIGSINLTGITTSGSTFHKNDHGIRTGDRVRLTDIGKMKHCSANGVYYARNVTADTWQIAGSPNGEIRAVGTSTGVKVERIRDLILADNHGFKRNWAVQTVGGEDAGLNDGTVYYVTRTHDDDFGLTDKVGHPPLELKTDSFIRVYRYVDGQRMFKKPSNTPGAIVGQIMNEQKAAGWCAPMTRAFNTASDSNGAAWLNVADEAGNVPAAFNPGTPLENVIRFLVDEGIAEVAGQGRELLLFNPNTGLVYDLARKIGNSAGRIPVKTDSTNKANTLTLRGEGSIITGAQFTEIGDTFGRLGRYITVSGVTTYPLADRLVEQFLTSALTPKREYQITEAGPEAVVTPALDFQRGDTVFVDIKGEAVSRRVAEWQITKGATESSDITVTTVIGDRITELTARIVKKLRNQNANTISRGTGLVLTASDNRKLVGPADVVATASGVFSTAGSPIASLAVSWSLPAVDEDETSIVAKRSEVWLRAEGELEGTPLTSTDGTSTTIPSLPSGQTLYVSVRAQSESGQWGDFSDEAEVTTGFPVVAPLAPSEPTMVTSMGTNTAIYDGMAMDGATPVEPLLGFAEVWLERGDWDGDTPPADETFVRVSTPLPGPGSMVDANVIIGEKYWYKLRAINTAGVVSPPSNSVIIRTEGVFLGDLEAQVADAIAAAQSAGEAAQEAADDAADAAAGAATAAAAAQVIAEKAAYASFSTEPDPDGANKWLFRKFDIQTAASDIPYLSRVIGYPISDAFYVPDGPNLVSNVGDWYIGMLRTIVTVDSGRDIVFTFTHDDGCAIYLDGVLKHSNATYASDGATIGIDAGTHVLDILWAEQNGGDGITNISPVIGGQVNSLTAPVSATLTAQQAGEAAVAAAAAQSTADFAQTTANGKNKTTFSTGSGTPTAVGRAEGDNHYNLNTGGLITAAWIIASSAWVSTTITSAVIANLDAGKITSGFIDVNRLQAGTIVAAKLAANTITAAQIAAGTITATELAANSVTAAKILAGTITADRLTAGTLTANEMAAATITGAKIAAGTITATNIQALGITTGLLAAGAVTAAKITAGTITANEIASGAITTVKLSATAIDGMTITGALIRTAASGARIEMTSANGIRGFDASSVVKTSMSNTTGLLTATDATITGTINATAGTFSGAIAVTGTLTASTTRIDTAGIRSYASTAFGTVEYAELAFAQLQMYSTSQDLDLRLSNTGLSFFRAGESFISAYQRLTLQNTAGGAGVSTLNLYDAAGSARIAAIGAYSATVSTSANMVVASNGVIARSTSSRRYKTSIEREIYEPAVLDIELVSWVDKAEVRGRDAVFAGEPERHHGAIAEQLDEIGMGHRVTYDEDGRPEAIDYARIALDLIPIVKALVEAVFPTGIPKP